MCVHKDTCSCKALKPSCRKVDEPSVLQTAGLMLLLTWDGETL